MANVTEDGKYSTTIPEFFCTSGFETAQRIFISAIGLPLSIVAILGNVLIIVTLRKVSFLRPPSKLLLVCLASTDLVVGLISHPLYSFHFMFPEHSKSCYYSELLFLSIGSLLCGVSLLTTTVISLDRLLALLLGLRYRQVVTVRRVRALVATFLVLFTFLAPLVFLSYRTTVGIHITEWFQLVVLLLCLMISTFCYTKIYCTLHFSQTQVQNQGHQGQPNEEANQLNKAKYKKTVSTALWLQMSLLVCYLPLFLVDAIYSISGLNTPLFNFAWTLSTSLMLSNSTLNPFLYCWKMREMRRAVKHTIRQLFRFSNEET
ncbi:trace amine-associated receptor 3-like [Stylophora pistillata]|uniref:trace amine-associated receptor 3-like n=1 Tax=Stylophora pistillata TaxID=50429 RepID=UPI000C04E97A|nr:trace amine-associated receptor 3-like [Stylophora pistillata]XP_022789821.1 trace amine-associated receptor 3-like [Stylophora pistillata]XP_022789823.1 trace amine-associated receptor 3-like [Stylophora pistillata]XP_022789824.1 trace amine-associated receptor 3-like [Stylophora pistillata]